MSQTSHLPALDYDSADEYIPQPAAALEPPAWCDGSVRIGIHTSIAGDITKALESAHKLGCNALQIFSGSPRMWFGGGARISEIDAARFRARRAELGLGPLVIHANYLINLAAVEPVLRTRSIQAFHEEMQRALALGADFLVVHPGSARGCEPADAVASAAQALRQASKGIRFSHARGREKQSGGLMVLLENTSGMGSCIGSRFEELRAIMDAAPELPLGVCLDTAHAFHAGYEIRTQQGIDRTLAELDKTVGLARVPVLHANDSKTPFGSRVDRHQHIGRGGIGLEAFRMLLNHPRLSARAPEGVPGRAFILETPIDAPGDDRRNVRALWGAAGVEVKQAPKAENGFSMARARRSAGRQAEKKTHPLQRAQRMGYPVAKAKSQTKSKTTSKRKR